MESFIVRSFFGGEILATVVTQAQSLDAAKANFLAWVDPRAEGVTIEPCGLGFSYGGIYWAIQDGMVVARSYDLLTWEEFEVEEEGVPADWDNWVNVIIH